MRTLADGCGHADAEGIILAGARVQLHLRRMEQPLFALVSLVLVSFCGGQDWTAPDFCHQQICPQYTLVETNPDFEERQYVATVWITTKIDSSSTADIMAAHSRLKDYCETQNSAVPGQIPVDTCPALITVTNGTALSLSWFLPPNTAIPQSSDPSVTLQRRPAATVYVRVFGGTPGIKIGQETAALLSEALVNAGKTFDSSTYSGAGYDSFFSLTHHNEVWVYAA